jgi:DNA polymerase-3 subunit alpha
MAAVLTTEMADSSKLATALEAARATGIEILPPCVNRSNAHFTVEDGRIRFGLGAIKGAGHAAIEALVEAREAAGGTFTDPFHLAGGLDLRTVGKKTLEVLASAGAMDAFEGHRAQFVAGMDTVWAYAQRTQQDRLAGQSSLFGGEASTESAFSPALPHIEPWGRGEQLRYERDLIGFYVSGHPLDEFTAEIRTFSTLALGDGESVEDNSDQTVIGIITAISRRTSKSGRPMAFVTLEDTSGQAEVVLFAQSLERNNHLLEVDQVVMVRGKVENKGGDLKVVAREVVPMWRVREMVKGLVLRVSTDHSTVEELDRLATLCEQHRGACKVYFEVSGTALARPVRLHARTAVVDLTPDFMKAITRQFGPDAVVLETEG